MPMNTCTNCGKELEAKSGAAFCPYCGGAVKVEEADGGESQEVKEIIAKAEAQQDARKKWQLLTDGEAKYPQSLSIAEELLFLGRLYDRDKKGVDFSIIKCYLLMLYLKPNTLSKKQQQEFRQELFQHPQLLKCVSLSGDGDAFLRRYLLRLEGEFIYLFLRGDSSYMRRIFGFGLDSRAPKLLADPVCFMLRNIYQDSQLTVQQRDMLMITLYQAFSKDMGGETKWLDETLATDGIQVPGL